MTLNFISEENFRKHILETVAQYGERLQPYDLKKLNGNLIDPIKLLFDTGWDVIFKRDGGIELDGDKVGTVYVEMKNKHNTMNSAASAKTYMKMQAQLLRDDNCACFLVEVIAKKSQNISWAISLDGQRQRHKRIRRVSIDKFYELVTGEEDAFYQMCMSLPVVIKKLLEETNTLKVPRDMAFSELQDKADGNSFELALFMLGFEDYLGFKKIN